MYNLEHTQVYNVMTQSLPFAYQHLSPSFLLSHIVSIQATCFHCCHLPFNKQHTTYFSCSFSLLLVCIQITMKTELPVVLCCPLISTFLLLPLCQLLYCNVGLIVDTVLAVTVTSYCSHCASCYCYTLQLQTVIHHRSSSES